MLRRFLTAAACLLLPRFAKPVALRLLGHRVANGASIGFSLIVADVLALERGTAIGRFNVITCRRLLLRHGCLIRDFNTIRGCFSVAMKRSAGIGKWNRIVRARDARGPALLHLAPGAGVALSHYINLDDSIGIGENSMLAGMHSQLWTHGFVHLSDRRTRAKVLGKIRIGANVYVGSACIVSPGVTIGDDVSLGAGCSVANALTEPGLYVPGPLRHIARTPEERLAKYERIDAQHAAGNPIYRGRVSRRPHEDGAP
jgi:acetyltransferase-like isoleucine patch superfamily enzyme